MTRVLLSRSRATVSYINPRLPKDGQTNKHTNTDRFLRWLIYRIVLRRCQEQWQQASKVTEARSDPKVGFVDDGAEEHSWTPRRCVERPGVSFLPQFPANEQYHGVESSRLAVLATLFLDVVHQT